MAIELRDDRTYSEGKTDPDEWHSWHNHSGYELQPIGSSSQYSYREVFTRIVNLLQHERTGFGIGHFDPFVAKRADTTYDDPNDFETFPPKRRVRGVLQVNSVRRGGFKPIEDE